MKHLPSLIAAVLLAIAVTHLPLWYYTLLRFLVTLAAIAVIWMEKDRALGFWVYLFGAVAILFNPILPVYFHDKSVWMPIDIAASAAFIAQVVRAVLWDRMRV